MELIKKKIGLFLWESRMGNFKIFNFQFPNNDQFSILKLKLEIK